MLTGLVKRGNERKASIVDSGGARSLMPLRLAQQKFGNLIQPIDDTRCSSIGSK